MEEKPLVFVIDDIADTAELLALFLQSANYSTRIFSGGIAALDALQTTGRLPDLIVLDLMMPGMDGIELIRRIHAHTLPGYIPIIMVTSSSESQNRILGLQTGADDFLTKPISRAELLARVRSLLRLKLAYDEKTRLLLEVQQAYYRLEATQGELFAAERSKLQMEAMMTTAAGICHEMSQPLTSALITLQLLRSVKTTDNVEDFQVIEQSLLQARVILDKLRALTRYETKTYIGDERILDIDRSSSASLRGFASHYLVEDTDDDNPGQLFPATN